MTFQGWLLIAAFTGIRGDSAVICFRIHSSLAPVTRDTYFADSTPDEVVRHPDVERAYLGQ